MEIKVKKSKTARGLPKRTGKRGNGGARHGNGPRGVKRNRSKMPGFRGVAVLVNGFFVKISKR